MSAPVFVTGGSGLVGGALVKRLIADGRAVRALGRSDTARSAIAALGAEPVPGDVLFEDELVHAIDGCDTVFHVAGVNAFCVRDLRELFDVNVRGSVTVVRAAARAGARRVVYTSSAATLGEPKGTVGTEQTVHRGRFLSYYEQSKYEAELAVMRAAREVEVEVVSVNPSSVQGPGRTGGTARVLILFLRGKLRTFVRTNISLIDIDDCMEGHILAEQRGVAGERYVLNSATWAIDDALEVLQRITGKEAHPRVLPGPIALTGATTVELVSRVRGRHPPVCREVVRTLLHGHRYDGSRAERELGLTYTPLEVTFRKTIEWLRAEGLV